MLLEHKADPNVQDKCGITPLLAVGRESQRNTSSFSFSSFDESPKDSRSYFIMKSLLDAGADVNAQGNKRFYKC